MSFAKLFKRRAAIMLFLVALVAPRIGSAVPKTLEPSAISSPSHHFKANVEWEDIGFIGVIRMNIFHPNGDPHFSLELPEISPSPANLMWIDDDWVACESFLGDKGSGFFYVHLPTRRAYLIDIIAPRPDADWILNFTTNDVVSSSAIRTISEDRSSLFPIRLHDLPTDGPDYFTIDFCEDLRNAVDDFTAYRKKEKFRNIEFLSAADVRTSVGAVAIASLDTSISAVYFPLGTTTTAQMLERSKRKLLPEDAQQLLNSTGAPVARVKWTDDNGGFRVEASDPDNASSVTLLMNGRFEDVHDDEPVTASEVVIEEAAPSEPKKESKKPIPAAKGKPSRSTKSSSKKPSRSR